jgi:two-component system KDP operon response regulator KdpE
MNSPANAATILVVEDDPSLNAALISTLKAAGYRPVAARTSAEGLRWFAHYAPDLVLLDLGLPDGDGLDVIRQVRARSNTPIVVLSARESEAVKVQALDLGADDYVQKPFGLDELMARIRTGLRHAVQARGSEPVVTTGALTIDFGRRAVTLAGEVIQLSPKEFGILSELAMNLDRTLAHRELLLAVWGERADIQYLRVYIGQLRRKLGPDLILSDPGVGYRMPCLVAAAAGAD